MAVARRAAEPFHLWGKSVYDVVILLKNGESMKFKTSDPRLSLHGELAELWRDVLERFVRLLDIEHFDVAAIAIQPSVQPHRGSRRGRIVEWPGGRPPK